MSGLLRGGARFARKLAVWLPLLLVALVVTAVVMPVFMRPARRRACGSIYDVEFRLAVLSADDAADSPLFDPSSRQRVSPGAALRLLAESSIDGYGSLLVGLPRAASVRPVAPPVGGQWFLVDIGRRFLPVSYPLGERLGEAQFTLVRCPTPLPVDVEERLHAVLGQHNGQPWYDRCHAMAPVLPHHCYVAFSSVSVSPPAAPPTGVGGHHAP